MKLSEMNLAQLRKKAKGLDIKLKGLDESDLVRAIKKARKEKEAAAPTGDPWPKEWDDARRKTYYVTIVGRAMPKNLTEAYANLVASIEAKVANASLPQTLPDGSQDCFGMQYGDDLDICQMHCPHMPLCRQLFESDPKVLEQVDAAEKALAEAEGASEADVQEALRVTVPKVVKPKAKKAGKTQKRYQWVGDINTYKKLKKSDLDTWQCYDSISKLSIVTEDACFRIFNEVFEDARDMAQRTLKFLIKKGDVVRS